MKIKGIFNETFDDAISPDSHMEFDSEAAYAFIMQKYHELESFHPDNIEELKDNLHVDGDNMLQIHQSLVEALKTLRRKGLF